MSTSTRSTAAGASGGERYEEKSGVDKKSAQQNGSQQNVHVTKRTCNKTYHVTKRRRNKAYGIAKCIIIRSMRTELRQRFRLVCAVTMLQDDLLRGMFCYGCVLFPGCFVTGTLRTSIQ